MATFTKADRDTLLKFAGFEYRKVSYDPKANVWIDQSGWYHNGTLISKNAPNLTGSLDAQVKYFWEKLLVIGGVSLHPHWTPGGWLYAATLQSATIRELDTNPAHAVALAILSYLNEKGNTKV